MNHKRRLKNLESQPVKHVDGGPKETALESAIRIGNKIKAERAADPEGCERRRQELLRKDGWPEGYNPTARELMDRILERRNE